MKTSSLRHLYHEETNDDGRSKPLTRRSIVNGEAEKQACILYQMHTRERVEALSKDELFALIEQLIDLNCELLAFSDEWFGDKRCIFESYYEGGRAGLLETAA